MPKGQRFNWEEIDPLLIVWAVEGKTVPQMVDRLSQFGIYNEKTVHNRIRKLIGAGRMRAVKKGTRGPNTLKGLKARRRRHGK